jgi:hypothetical protein
LALQFTNKQIKDGDESKVDKLCDLLSLPEDKRPLISHERRGGSVARYVRYSLRIVEEDHEVPARSIQASVKQLVMERLLEHRLAKEGIQAGAAGLSAITALTTAAFRCLPLEDIPSFIDHLFHPPRGIRLPVKPEPVFVPLVDLLKEISPWYKDFQTYYDNKIRSEDRLSKRLCLRQVTEQRIPTQSTHQASESYDSNETSDSLRDRTVSQMQQMLSAPTSPAVYQNSLSSNGASTASSGLARIASQPYPSFLENGINTAGLTQIAPQPYNYDPYGTASLERIASQPDIFAQNPFCNASAGGDVAQSMCYNSSLDDMALFSFPS